MTERTATVRQCAVLVGGMGLRLGALTASTPKPLLPCGDRPFVAWLLREFIRFGVTDFLLLAGHLSDRVRDALPAIRATLPEIVRIEVAEDPVRAGTGGALHHARGALEEKFLLTNGDSLLDTNLSALFADAARDGDDVRGRMLLRALPDASRYGVVALDGDRVTAFSERPAPGRPGTINAGVYVLDRRVAQQAASVCSLERDVLPALTAEGALRGTVADGYFIDIGVPDDFARAQSEVPARLHRPALFLDRDGVVNVDHGWVGTRDRFEWNEDSRAAIRAATDAGWHVFVVTNQSGVARGLYTEADVRTLHDWMSGEVRASGGTLDGIRYCPHHVAGIAPDYARACSWRKPGPGMIDDLVRAWSLDRSRCVLVGDQPTDIAAADAAGIDWVRYEGGSVVEVIERIIACGPTRT